MLIAAVVTVGVVASTLKAYLHGRFQLCDMAVRCVFEAKVSTTDCVAISLEKFLFTLKSHRNVMSQYIIARVNSPLKRHDGRRNDAKLRQCVNEKFKFIILRI